MEDKNLKKSEEPFGQEFEVKKNTNNANRIGFSNTLFSVGEKVYLLSEQQHFDLIKEIDQVYEYKDRIKELENIISNNSDKNNLEELKEKLQEEVIISNLKTKLEELTKKLESLSGLKEYIPPKEHESLEELKDKIKEIETELNKVNAEVDLKLTNQKFDIELKHTEEKAQMLLVYTQKLNAYKLKYNGLAKDYNHLLRDTKSLTRINTIFNGKHNLIVKDKESVELEVIDVEKEPTETIEYIPKR